MPETPAAGSGPRLREAMPRGLLIAFVVFAVIAVAAAAVVLLKPSTFETVPVEARRPPPRGTFSHDVARLIAAPTPSVVPTLAPPCEAVSGARLIGGGNAVLRLRAVLEVACRLQTGVSASVGTAVRALDTTTIRFGEFERSGAESTLDVSTRTIWLNLKFAERKMPVSHLVPVVLHDAWHLARAGKPFDAAEELEARRVEVAACRHAVEIAKWPRWCTDARVLTDLEPARALALLRAAGFA